MRIFKDKIILSIEISEDCLKLISISSKAKKSQITGRIFKELLSSDSVEVEAQLRQALKELDAAPQEIILVIPRQSVTTKTVKLPSRDPLEIEEMAGFQALKQIPYSKDEIIYGFKVIGVDAEGYSDVMLVICHKDAVERPIAALKNCGLIPAKVTLSSFGLLNWFNLDEELRRKADISAVMVVECDMKDSDIAIIRSGRLIYTRGLAFGASEGIRYAERLISDIKKTLTVYEKETKAGHPAEVVFTGSISALADSAGLIKESLNMPSEIIGSFKNISLNVTAEEASLEAKTSYSSLIGSIAGPEEVDLLPRTLKFALAARLKKRDFMTAVILMFFVVASLSYAVVNKIARKEGVLRDLESILKETNPEAQRLDKMRLVSEIIKSQSKKKKEALDILNELYKIIPSDIYLVMYTYEGGMIELKGTASVLSEVFRLVTILENSPCFQNVRVRYATKRKAGSQEFVDFEIACSVCENPAEGK
ncbi:MAG: pilus assembly protein PilM [Candidatus Omnitrophota bacterium]